MRLYFKKNQEIRCVTADNRAMASKCNKLMSSDAALDLIPRVRYMIDLSEPLVPFAPSAKLLFDLGLHLVPMTNPNDELVHKIVAINLSDKIIRISSGMNLSDESEDFKKSGTEDQPAGADF